MPRPDIIAWWRLWCPLTMHGERYIIYPAVEMPVGWVSRYPLAC